MGLFAESRFHFASPNRLFGEVYASSRQGPGKHYVRLVPRHSPCDRSSEAFSGKGLHVLRFNVSHFALTNPLI